MYLKNIVFNIIMYHSQYKQDQFLEENVFKGFTNGFFMDVGAHDGITINNTLFFEKYRNWNGINIEANKSIYDKLIINRPDNININCAVCNDDGKAEFICNTGYTEMLSGLKDSFDVRHLNRVETENKEMGGTTEIITVNTCKFETICDKYNIKHINYLSIDVEGGEFEVIKSINFDKVFIDIIEFESNYNDISDFIINYLEEKNYKIIHKSLDIFMIHIKSNFYR